jgi:hypothetical protein
LRACCSGGTGDSLRAGWTLRTGRAGGAGCSGVALGAGWTAVAVDRPQRIRRGLEFLSRFQRRKLADPRGRAYGHFQIPLRADERAEAEIQIHSDQSIEDCDCVDGLRRADL